MSRGIVRIKERSEIGCPWTLTVKLVAQSVHTKGHVQGVPKKPKTIEITYC